MRIGAVELGDERVVGRIVGPTPTDPRRDRPLARVDRARHAGRHAGDDAGALGDAAESTVSLPVYVRGTRAPMPVTISYEMVPSRSAHSVAVISSSPCRPMSTTSSPASTGGSPTSTISWSIVTTPAIG